MTRRTKIVATLGPASEHPAVIRDMITAGVDVFRLNLSHGDVESHLQRLADVRAVAAELDKHVGVLADLPGPKIRAGRFPDGGVTLDPAATIHLEPGHGPSDAGTIRVEYPTLLDDLKVGAHVQLGDGAIALRITAVREDHATATVEAGGRANGSPGVHIPSDAMRLMTPTDEDLVLAETMAAAGVDFMAVSFVRAAADVEKVREVVGDRADLVAKMETASSVANLESIVEAADAIMVARGDLGIDCPIEDVPHLQKRIVRHCVSEGVPVITATQMLESMINSPSPTRAEVSDVANAVFDGTDAVMLSGETAIGRDPVSVINTMSTVAERAEGEASYRAWANRLGREQRVGDFDAPERITMALTHAASQAAIDGDVSAILCCTRTGLTARAMARFRPDATMVGLAPDASMARRMSLIWGVDPLTVEVYTSTDDMVWFAVETALQRNEIEHGDTVLVLAGAPAPARPGAERMRPATDVLRLVQVS